MPGIFPDSTAGGVVVRDIDGNCLFPAGVPNAYCPPAEFTTSCLVTALATDCNSRLTVQWANSLNSELLCLAVALEPSGNWNCGSQCNLSTAFQNWYTNFHDNVLVDLIDDAVGDATVGVITEAPINDFQYARKAGGWVQTTTPIINTGVPSGPFIDGQTWWNPSTNEYGIWMQTIGAFTTLNPVNPAPPDALSTINEFKVTSTQVWNKPVGLKYLEVEGVGPGGGAGGAAATTGANSSAAGGAGAGAWGKRLFTEAELPASLTITVAAPGVGATGSTGSAGGTSEFGSGFDCTLGGGLGSARTTLVVTMARSNGGAGGALGVGWTVGRKGEEGDAGYAAFANEPSLVQAGAGGATLYGTSPASAVSSGGGGINGSGFGSGGQGTGSTSASSAVKTGGNGAPSFFLLREIF